MRILAIGDASPRAGSRSACSSVVRRLEIAGELVGDLVIVERHVMRPMRKHVAQRIVFEPGFAIGEPILARVRPRLGDRKVVVDLIAGVDEERWRIEPGAAGGSFRDRARVGRGERASSR